MKIKYISITIDDQEKALKFYTEKLGFKKCVDIPVGEYRWLTLNSPEGVYGVELVLEPLGFEPAKIYQKELFNAGIPITMFMTDDIEKEYKRLKDFGVVFKSEPVNHGSVVTTMFEDTCGNLINLSQVIEAK